MGLSAITLERRREMSFIKRWLKGDIADPINAASNVTLVGALVGLLGVFLWFGMPVMYALTRGDWAIRLCRLGRCLVGICAPTIVAFYVAGVVSTIARLIPSLIVRWAIMLAVGGVLTFLGASWMLANLP